MDRRKFSQLILSATAGLSVSAFSNAADLMYSDRLGEVLPRRKLGGTNESITMLGLGGAHIVWANEKEAQRVIETALEGGIRFFDTAEGYGDGLSERRYGKFLTPKYREDVFLMTKTGAYTAKEARKHLEGSLRRMDTDYIDLWQIHAIETYEDVDNRIKNEILEVMHEAKESGKVRYVGFTGHAHPNVHLRMIERSQDQLRYDACQMPVNVMDASFQSFIKNVMPVLINNQTGILAMKTLAEGRFFKEKIENENYRNSHDAVIPDRMSIQDALYYVWSLPVSTVITGAERVEYLEDKIAYARSFSKLTNQQMMDLTDKVVDLVDFAVEEYKRNDDNI